MRYYGDYYTQCKLYLLGANKALRKTVYIVHSSNRAEF